MPRNRENVEGRKLESLRTFAKVRIGFLKKLLRPFFYLPASPLAMSSIRILCLHFYSAQEQKSVDVCSLRSGVIFTNVLQAAFIRADPKSAIKLLNLTDFWRFWDLRA